jgi:hypothetical protein
MWSGPRNISTALLRSWENRPDTAVVDEPLYAHYLFHTRLDHPGAEEVIAAGPVDWLEAVRLLLGPVPGGKLIFYQKHMSHHLLPRIERDWIYQLTNAFLIRDPREMLLSLAKVLPSPRLVDTGLPQQVELFDEITIRTGQSPPVIDARDVLLDPEGVLSALCRRLGVPFTQAMLSWPPGRRESDGVWAPYWYEAVERSTHFEPYRPRLEPLPAHVEPLLDECSELYRKLASHRIRAAADETS